MSFLLSSLNRPVYMLHEVYPYFVGEGNHAGFRAYILSNLRSVPH